MQELHQHVSPNHTPQTEPIPGREADMKPNSAGGFGFRISRADQVLRFLMLGTVGGTYYATERKLTRDNADNLRRALEEDGPEVVRLIVEVSDQGRAPKNDPVLFALALASTMPDVETRRAAFAALPKVARTGTHLFMFATYRREFGGWGRGMKRAVASWYEDMSTDRLAYQVLKYRQRYGWEHRDLLRLSHPAPGNPILGWVAGKVAAADAHPKIAAFEEVQDPTTPLKRVEDLILEHRLPREALPTHLLKEPRIWRTMLLAGMPLTAMVRNLGVMTANGTLNPLSDMTAHVVAALTSRSRIQGARLHPLDVLIARLTYANGQGMQGKLRWSPISTISTALEDAFYLAFDNVEPTGKRTVVALDVSASMGWTDLLGITGLTPAAVSAALAMTVLRTEEQVHPMAFSHMLMPLDITRQTSLLGVMEAARRIGGGGTNCGLPMWWAREKKVPVDTFIIFTDNETWVGAPHPATELQRYRQAMDIDAKLIVVAMTATDFSIADPADAGMLDVAGFDSALPAVIANFNRGFATPDKDSA